MNTNHREPNGGDLDEALLTAYALGQLGEGERAAVEAKLAASQRARQFVEETAVLAQHVGEAWRAGPPLQKSPALRDAVQRTLAELEDSQMKTEHETWPASQPRRAGRHARVVALAVCLFIVAIPLYLVIAGSANRARHRDAVELARVDHAGRSATQRREELERKSLRDASESEKTAANHEAKSAAAGATPDDAALSSFEAVFDPSVPSSATPQTAPNYGWTKVPPVEVLAGAYGKDNQAPGPTTVAHGQVQQGVGQQLAGSMQLAQEVQTRGGGRLLGFATDPSSQPDPGPVLVQGLGPGTGLGPGAGPGPAEAVKVVGPSGLTVVTNSGIAPGGASGAGLGQGPGMRPTVTYHAGAGNGGALPVSGPGAAALRGWRSPAPSTEYAVVSGSGRVVYHGDGRERHYYPYNPRGRGDDDGDVRRHEALAGEAPGTEQYDPIVENPFVPCTGKQAKSTFAIDVDTASYANVRRFLNEGRLPPPDAVRIEEMVNYFKYDYPQPQGNAPFSVDMEVAQCPWNGEHRLLRVGIKGKEIEREERGPSNLVFLLDVSGSMRDQNKLPLVKRAMTMLVDQLTEDDRVAIVTYASGTEVKLESTCGSEREEIRGAIESLSAGGSTHGSAGIQLAYERATSHFVEGGTNRVILATDGDLNVGITDDDELVKLIQEKAQSGVFLTVLGFGTGNLKDAKMEKLADKGNGAYAYIDGEREANKVLVEQLSGSLITIAKDVKIQIEFNPAEVQSYRLIGYENRLMAAKDFRNDKKDAGEIGAGHTVTALYEIVPAGGTSTAETGKGDEGLKYQRTPKPPLSKRAGSGELLTLWLRYKEPDGEKAEELEFIVTDGEKRFGEASADTRFASAVAAFGMVLRGSQHAGDLTLSAVEEFAAGATGEDPKGYRAEFVDLVRRARQISGR